MTGPLYLKKPALLHHKDHCNAAPSPHNLKAPNFRNSSGKRPDSQESSSLQPRAPVETLANLLQKCIHQSCAALENSEKRQPPATKTRVAGTGKRTRMRAVTMMTTVTRKTKTTTRPAALAAAGATAMETPPPPCEAQDPKY